MIDGDIVGEEKNVRMGGWGFIVYRVGKKRVDVGTLS